jgi:hypothetical protein
MALRPCDSPDSIASRHSSQALAQGLRSGRDPGVGAVASADLTPKSVVTSLAGFAGGRRPHPPGGRIACHHHRRDHGGIHSEDVSAIPARPANTTMAAHPGDRLR